MFLDSSEILDRPGGEVLLRGIADYLRDYVDSKDRSGAFDKALADLRMATGFDPLGASGRFIASRRGPIKGYDFFWKPRLFNVIGQGSFSIRSEVIESLFGSQERAATPAGEVYFHQTSDSNDYVPSTWAAAVKDKSLLFLGSKKWVDAALQGKRTTTLSPRLSLLASKIRYPNQLWGVRDSPDFSRRLLEFLPQEASESVCCARMVYSLDVNESLRLEVRLIAETPAGAQAWLNTLRKVSQLLLKEWSSSDEPEDRLFLRELRNRAHYELNSNELIWRAHLPAEVLPASSQLVGLALLLTLNSL